MTNKTIGMITIYKKNYGAFFQAYALQKTLISLGYKPQIIRFDYSKYNSILGVPIYDAKKPLEFIIKLGVRIIRWKSNKRYEAVFNTCIEKYLVESNEYYKSYEELEKNPPHYDIFLTGSDQVFNPVLSPQARMARFLCFSNGVKVSYAASAGEAFLPNEYKRWVFSELKQFNRISIREKAFCDYLESEAHLHSSWNVDPVFLLRREQWICFASDKIRNEKYIFYYEVNKQDKLYKEAIVVSQKTGLPVLKGNGRRRFSNEVTVESPLSPEKWLSALLHAELVITNSFHGSAFSIILHKQFRTVLPDVGKERVKSILNTFDFDEVLSKLIIDKTYFDTRFIKADKLIDAEIHRSLLFLKDIGEL